MCLHPACPRCRRPCWYAGLSSFTTSASVAVASRVPATVLVEVDMPWQLVTAHDSGVVQVWGHIDSQRALQPLVRIGERVAPALRLVVCEPLGALITAHNGERCRRSACSARACMKGTCSACAALPATPSPPRPASPRVASHQALAPPAALLPSPPHPRSDGKLRVRPLHHPRSSRGLKIVYQDGSVSKVGEASLPCVQLDTSRSGLATALGGRVGVLTASNSAAIKLFPVAEMRRLAEEAGIAVQSPLAEMAQVRGCRLPRRSRRGSLPVRARLWRPVLALGRPAWLVPGRRSRRGSVLGSGPATVPQWPHLPRAAPAVAGVPLHQLGPATAPGGTGAGGAAVQPGL